MWTDITRAQHARKDLRLPSDLTDAERQIFEPLMPRAAKTGLPRGAARSAWHVWRSKIGCCLPRFPMAPVSKAIRICGSGSGDQSTCDPVSACAKLGISFWDYLGERLKIADTPPVPYLPDIVSRRSAFA